MGGQQFASGAVLLDIRPMNRSSALDAERGVVEAEAGIQWPELVDGLIAMQQGAAAALGHHPEADRRRPAHARRRARRQYPWPRPRAAADHRRRRVVHADGRRRQLCAPAAARENSELFRLAIGGYGLFGVVTRVRLRLMPRTKIERVVRHHRHRRAHAGLRASASREGFLYGDCQFSTDASSDTYLRKGVFSCYRPLPPDTPMPAEQKELGEAHWRELYYLSHADTRRAYEAYTSYYLSTTGQRYWSDLHQLSVYIDDYHADLDRRLDAPHKGTRDDHRALCAAPALCPRSSRPCAPTSASTARSSSTAPFA